MPSSTWRTSSPNCTRVTIRDGLAFPNYFTAWQDGQPLDPEAPGYARTLLDQLAWWAAVLSAARDASPYRA